VHRGWHITHMRGIATQIDKTSSPLLGESPVASLLERSEGRLGCATRHSARQNGS
jgi:hypothetical protein